MKLLDLDFCQKRPIASYAGFALLVAGLLLGIYGVGVFSKYNTQKIKTEADLRRLHEPQQEGTAALDGKELESAMQRASVVIDRLAFPWNNLFKTLESSTVGEDVALLAIRPDVAGGKVEVDAEARDWNAMVSYIKHLGSEKFFNDVHLVSHQQQQNDPQRPVRFVLSCSWNAVHAK